MRRSLLYRGVLREPAGFVRGGDVPEPAGLVDDRRSVLIEITPDGRATADQLLPGIRSVERSILSALSQDERAHLLDLLARVLARAADVAAGPAEPLGGQRIRPARLGTPGAGPGRESAVPS